MTPSQRLHTQQRLADGKPRGANTPRRFANGKLRPANTKLRAAIVLTGLQQLSPDDAAELEGCSVATMYWRIHEARRLLEERLADYLAP